MIVCAAVAVAAAREIRFVLPVVCVLAVLLVAATAAAATYLRAPQPGTGKRLELLSGLWTLTMYLSVGVVPLVVRWWNGS
jgi:4-hydroxybenzoate polyprenyltransferase